MNILSQAGINSNIEYQQEKLRFIQAQYIEEMNRLYKISGLEQYHNSRPISMTVNFEQLCEVQKKDGIMIMPSDIKLNISLSFDPFVENIRNELEQLVLKEVFKYLN